MAVEVRPAPPSALEELIRSVADTPDRPKPWVDVATYPWNEEEFSSRYVRRANYQSLYGMKDTGDEVEDIITLLNPQPKARLLDLCSGNGRHAIAMALRGYRVTGIDIGPGAVSLARDTARNLGLSVDFRQLDVLHISFEDLYDGAYLTCGGFSDFSPAEGQVLLQAVERALSPNGRIVLEFADADAGRAPDLRTWQFVQAETSLYMDGSHLQLDERNFDPEPATEVERCYVVPSDGRVREFTRCRQLYTEASMRSALESARFDMLSFSAGSAPGLKKAAAKKR